jgi:hypothetical protein
MRDYVVKVACRKRRSLGRFTERGFIVSMMPDNPSRSQVWDAWYAVYAEEWEPSHIVSFREDMPGPSRDEIERTYAS